MSTTFIDPPGPLANTSEPIDFTTDNLVTSISIEFAPRRGNSLRETVWDGTHDADNGGGDFSYRYRLSSHSDLSGGGPYTWHVVRDSVWPEEFRIRVKEATDTGYRPSVGTLQPTLYSPLGQWALRGAPDNPTLRADRSGNGRNFTSGTGHRVPDAQTGQFAANDLSMQATDSVIGNLSGAATITARAQLVLTSTSQDVFGIGSADSLTNDLLVFSVSSAGKLAYYSQHANDVNTIWESSLVAPQNQWVFLSLRRHTDGTVTVGINQTYQTSGALAPATVRGGTSIHGWSLYAPAPDLWAGALADVCLWGRDLTDAEMIPLFKAAMGVP